MAIYQITFDPSAQKGEVEVDSKVDTNTEQAEISTEKFNDSIRNVGQAEHGHSIRDLLNQGQEESSYKIPNVGPLGHRIDPGVISQAADILNTARRQAGLDDFVIPEQIQQDMMGKPAPEESFRVSRGISIDEPATDIDKEASPAESVREHFGPSETYRSLRESRETVRAKPVEEATDTESEEVSVERTSRYSRKELLGLTEVLEEARDTLEEGISMKKGVSDAEEPEVQKTKDPEQIKHEAKLNKANQILEKVGLDQETIDKYLPSDESQLAFAAMIKEKMSIIKTPSNLKRYADLLLPTDEVQKRFMEGIKSVEDSRTGVDAYLPSDEVQKQFSSVLSHVNAPSSGNVYLTPEQLNAIMTILSILEQQGINFNQLQDTLLPTDEMQRIFLNKMDRNKQGANGLGESQTTEQLVEEYNLLKKSLEASGRNISILETYLPSDQVQAAYISALKANKQAGVTNQLFELLAPTDEAQIASKK